MAKVVSFKNSAPAVSEWERLSSGTIPVIQGQGKKKQASLRWEGNGGDVDGIPLSIFYGWIRLGLPSEPDALWATPTETLLTTLSAAIAQKIVPSGIGADLSSVGARIEKIKAERAVGAARTLRLIELTGGHLPMIEALQRMLEAAGESEGTVRPLAALRPDEWLDLAYKHGTPNGSVMTPAAYADALAANVERQYPTAQID